MKQVIYYGLYSTCLHPHNPTGIWIPMSHGLSPTTNWEGSQEQPFHWPLAAMFSIKPKKIAEGHSKTECISMLQKSGLIIFVNKIPKKKPS